MKFIDFVMTVATAVVITLILLGWAIRVGQLCDLWPAREATTIRCLAMIERPRLRM